MSEPAAEFEPPRNIYDLWADIHLLSRRQAIGLGTLTLGAFASTAVFAEASTLRFSKESEGDLARPYPNVHGGNGTISLRPFRFDKTPAPANFIIYDIPTGASEGVHTHRRGDTVLGPFDEYYYIIEGQGEMQIDGNVVPVKIGDHVHTPLGVSHGISNTMSKGNLKVFLTYITRES